MTTPEEIKAELLKRHDAGQARGDDRLCLDALELIVNLETENKRLKQAILDFGNNPAGFDWGVLERISTLEEALEWWIDANKGAPNKYEWAEKALKDKP